MRKLTEAEAYQIQLAIHDAMYGSKAVGMEEIRLVANAAVGVRQILEVLGIASYDQDPEEPMGPTVVHARFTSRR